MGAVSSESFLDLKILSVSPRIDLNASISMAISVISQPQVLKGSQDLYGPSAHMLATPSEDRSSCEMYVHSRTVHGRQQWVFQSEHKCSYIGEFQSPVNLFQYLDYSHQVHIPKSLSCSKYVLKKASKLLLYQMLSTCLFTLCIQDREDWDWNHSSFEADGM